MKLDPAIQRIIIEWTGLPVRDSDIDAVCKVLWIAKTLQPYPLNPFSPVPDIPSVMR
ncbi:MAG: hypothetical protein M1318_01460 [Firmicutes bacterium]|nr:hypothetical protein [Bacillota bacterium]